MKSSISPSYSRVGASAYPVFDHQSAARSPGTGTIPATSTISSTGTLAHTSGAVKAPSECATRTRSPRSPIAATSVSAYSARPADSSSTGRSTATTSWPRSRSSAATRSQLDATSPAPGMTTNVATELGGFGVRRLFLVSRRVLRALGHRLQHRERDRDRGQHERRTDPERHVIAAGERGGEALALVGQAVGPRGRHRREDGKAERAAD